MSPNLKYFITFQSEHRPMLALEVYKTEATWIASTEAELHEKLKSIDANRHKVIRIVKGEDVPFVQSTSLVTLQLGTAPSEGKKKL
jgi:hypothetical protein